jgi:hypothetical protein
LGDVDDNADEKDGSPYSLVGFYVSEKNEYKCHECRCMEKGTYNDPENEFPIFPIV